MASRTPSLLVSLAGFTLSALAGAVTITEQAQLRPAEQAPSFGLAVALDGGTAVLGKPAYIFQGSGASWSEQTQLVPSGTPAEPGRQVAISGDTVAVGATDAVYVFQGSGASWTEQASLSAAAGEGFGTSVAISGDTLVVGAVDADKVYVYVRSSGVWSLQAELTPSDGPDKQFGHSVAIEGDTLVVGAPTSSGAVYVFTRSGATWSERTRLLGTNAVWLGEKVAISGNTVVGTSIFVTGSAYVFVGSGASWTQQARLEASDAFGFNGFGTSVALSGEMVVVGATSVDDFRGAAYVFTRSGSTWSQTVRLDASDRQQFDSFGRAVALSGGIAMVGSGDATVGSTGAVYVYPLFGVAVTPTADLLTLETGSSTAAFTVRLNGQPAGDVVIDVASSDTGEGTVSPAQLTFTTANWTTPQTVTLTGVDDMTADGGQPYTAILTINQTLTLDPVYDAIDPADVSAVNLEFAGDFFLTTPCRVLDTRLAGPPLTSAASRTVTFHGVCGVPSTARAVAVTAVVVDPTTAGSLALFPSGFPRPGVDLVSFPLGKTLAGNAIVLLATDGTGTLDAAAFFSQPWGTAHLAIDLAGYFE